MRIGLRDILGLADFEQNLTELSALADACLQYALEVVLRKNKFKTAPLVVIGMGKLGGAEINYGSDLDVMFVTDAKPRDLPRQQRLAIEMMELISSRTESGLVFVTDARLRPDGEKGLLVNTLEAYEDYYRSRAQLWEIQSISRTRPVAGNMELGRRFQEMVAPLTDFTHGNVTASAATTEIRSIQGKKCQILVTSSPTKTGSKANPPPHVGGYNAHERPGVVAYTPKWKEKICQMRQRIEKERTPAGQDALAIKTGAGGLMDAEFLAQTFCLENGWQEANTLRALLQARDAGALARKDADRLIENYRRLRRVEGILRRWSYEGETMLPDEEAPFYRVAIRCGFGTAEEFRRELKKMREAIRAVYNKVFCE